MDALNSNWNNAQAWQVTEASAAEIAGGLVVNARSTRAPVSTDKLLFNDLSVVNCNFNTVVPAPPTEIASISFDVGFTGRLNLGSTLIVHGGSLKTKTPNLAFYTIGGAGDFVIAKDATFTWNSGTMAGTGKTIVSAGATLNIVSDVAPQLDARLAGRELVVKPTFPSVQPGNLVIPSGVVNFTSGQIFGQGNITNAGIFNISGTAKQIIQGTAFKFTNEAGGYVNLNLVNATDTFDISNQFVNKSTIASTIYPGGVTITKGHLVLGGGGSSSGTWSVASDQFLIFGASLGGPTQFLWDKGTAFGGQGTVQVRNSLVSLASGSSIEIAPVLFFTGGTIEAGAGGNKPVLQIKNVFAWISGAFQGPGLLKLNPETTTYIYGGQNVASTPTLNQWLIENSGSIALGKLAGNDAATRTDLQMGNGAVIKNVATGTFRIVDTSGIKGIPGLVPTPGLDVLGTIEGPGGSVIKVANSGDSTLEIKTITDGENGILKVNPGAGVVQGSNTIRVPATAPTKKMSFKGPYNLDTGVAVGATGSLVGDGSVTTSAFSNAGTVLPGDFGVAGLLTFNGNFTQNATGALAMDIGGGVGAVAGTDFDQLIIGEAGNQVTLGGALHLSVLPSLSAAVGTVFGLIDNKSSLAVAGTFAGLSNGAYITVGGYTFQINYDGKLDSADVYSNDVTLTVIGTPATSSNTASVSGVVWNDSNDNGLLDATETLAQGIAVDLTDAQGNSQRAYTNSSGQYNFSQLAAGSNYTVKFDLTTNTAYAARFTTYHATPNASTLPDSDANQVTGTTASFSLTTGQTVTNLDAGLTANAAPVAVGDEYTVGRNQTLTVNAANGVLANDTDAESDTLTAILAEGPTNGTLVLNSNGSFTYTPATGFAGSDLFTYRAADVFGSGALVTVLIQVTNTPPAVVDDTASTNEDTAVAVSVLSNDTDANSDPLAVIGATNGDHGTVTFTATGVTYTTDANWHGVDTFAYTVSDSFGGVAIATVTVTVAPVNDAPVAVNGSATTPQNAPVDIDLRTLVTDVETAPADMTFAVSGATNGTVSLLGDGHTARFTPGTGYHGSASFTYTATDTGDGVSAAITTSAKTVTISANSRPTAADISATVHAGGSTTLYPAWTDPDGDMVTVTSFTQGTHGTVTSGMGGFGLTYTASSATYTGADSFTYTITDGYGGTSTGTVTITLTNTVPAANNMSISIHAGGSANVYPMYFDIDGDMVTLTGYTQGSHGSVTTGMGGFGLAYTASSPTYTGTDSFTYTVNDGHGGSATGTVTVTLTNTPPTANNVSASTSAGTPVTVYPMYFDMDGDTVTVSAFSQGSHGTVTTVMGGFGLAYAPASGFTGTDTFTYTLDDGHGGTATATITITVT